MARALGLANLMDHQIGGRRNLIINGAMQVSQRYGTSRTFVTANLDGYALDRWNPGQYQKGGHQQVSVTDSSVPTTKAVRVSSSSSTEASGGTRMAFGQIVEHANCDFVAGRTVTLSFWIRFSSATISGTTDGFAFQLSEYDTVDPDFGITGATRTNDTTISNGSYPTTWTKYTKTITCASTVKNIGVRFTFSNQFNTANNEDEWYEVTAVQLELGDTATPFEHRSYGEELALCQRYYCKTQGSIRGVATAGSQLYVNHIYWPQEMRAAPAATLSGGTTNGTTSVPSPVQSGVRFVFQTTSSGGFYALNHTVTADAEL